MWDVIAGCDRQLRVAGMGVPFALDFGAVMTMGAARGVDAELLAEMLPHAERTILSGGADDQPDDGED